ncbi:MAG: hypothetical protein JWL82_8 [Parcubacteria group bacterium]|nr:hypothetical protein [Parcubacteria group bacterium]
MSSFMRTNAQALLFGSALFALLAALPLGAQAATLTLPSRGPYTVGQTFSVPMYVSTRSGEAMNAVQATLSYPTDKLQALSVVKGSIVTFWTQEPTIANGSVTLEGGVYNPGFTGTNGTIVTVQFKVLSAGSAALNFSSASVLANDGQGTNILDSATGSTITLTAGAVVPAPVPVTPPAPSTSIVVTSSTHPNSNNWYGAHNVAFALRNPAGTTAVRIGYDKLPTAPPTVAYEPPITRKDVTLEDGVWYFHAQARAASGWGSVTTYRVRIDSVVPDAFTVSFPEGDAGSSAEPKVRAVATDALSGISYYTVAVNAGSAVTVEKTALEKGTYMATGLIPGENKLTVVAYDQAGNATRAEATYHLTAPVIPTVTPTNPALSFGWLTLNIVALGLLALLLLLALVLLLLYLWRRLHHVRRHILHRADPIHRALHKEFESLKDSIAQEIGALEQVKSRRALTEEEGKILDRLTILVDRSEKVIENEMESLMAEKRRRPSTGGMG